MPENEMNKVVMLAMSWFGSSHSEGQTYAKLGVMKKRRKNLKKKKLCLR
jgi:hypothetical protein